MDYESFSESHFQSDFLSLAFEVEATGSNVASVGINYTVSFMIEKYGKLFYLK